MAEVLALESISKRYGRTEALSNVSLTVGAGEVFGVLGPNGSGKTTMLSIVLGATRPSQGQFRWFGKEASAHARRQIGALLELPAFYPWLSGLRNIKIMAAIKGISEGDAEPPLRAVGLWQERNLSYQAYSLGMKQRLGIAAALMGHPKLLVLDEPTNGVDAQGIADIRGIIDQFARQGGTVMLASHILDEVEKVCSHVAILKHGKVLKSGAIHYALATQRWIDLATSDLAALEHALHALYPQARIEKRGEHLELHGAAASPSEINARLCAQGIIVGHMIERLPSLESQYLQVVDS